MKIKLILIIIMLNIANYSNISDCLKKYFCYCFNFKTYKNEETLFLEFNDSDIINYDNISYLQKKDNLIKSKDNLENILEYSDNYKQFQIQKNNSSKTMMQDKKECLNSSVFQNINEVDNNNNDDDIYNNGNRKSSSKESSDKERLFTQTKNGNSDNRTVSQNSFNIFKPKLSDPYFNNSENINNFKIKIGLVHNDSINNDENNLNKTFNIKEKMNKQCKNSSKRNQSLNFLKIVKFNDKKDENHSSK